MTEHIGLKTYVNGSWWVLPCDHENRSLNFAAEWLFCGARAAGHFLFPLPGFDFATSLIICSFIVLKYYHS